MVLSRRCAQSTIRGKASQVYRARSCVACRRASLSVRRNPRKPNPSGQVGPLINRQRNSLSRARARAKIASREKFALYAQSASKNLRQVLEGARENRFDYDKRTPGGRFLSIDPVTADLNAADGFNRYDYANNNPYKYIDPDGRAPWPVDLVKAAINIAKQATKVGGREAAKGAAKEATKDGAKAATSNAARREVMRKEGIPTSQQPVSQSVNASGREYKYEVPKEGGGTEIRSVQQQTMDRSHPGENHWEAGKVKVDERTGEIRETNHGRPKLQNDKSKVDY